MKAIIVDTETTGIDDPIPVEVAYCQLDLSMGRAADYVVTRHNPGKPITYGAMATHHITNEMVANEPLWRPWLVLPEGAQYLIGHNVDYDWQALGKPPCKRICTLALSRKLWPQMDSHSLGAMIYMLDSGYAQSVAPKSHSAAVDVALCARLLMEIHELEPITSFEELWQRSEIARIPEFMTFGKYDGRDGKPPMRCADVKQLDPGYYRWLLSSCDQVREDPYLRKALG